jgi:penicillin-binding protein 1A
MIRKILKNLIVTLLTLAILICLAVWGVLHYFVVLHPGEEIALSNIQSILGKESPVLYSDGVTPLGVFFDDAHRQYVSYEQIPESFVNALVASEDNRFFEHHGFDPVSITRAAIKNYEAGRVVQGGSTLTQQTAKNLFKRSGRSYEAKLKELLYALRLEHHYSKEKIFEFYSNQFYVRGNGHGLGVAARYYFDKNVEDLTLIESAFIAGSVKRPNYYNPFIRKSETSKKDVRHRVDIRVKYVLGQMKELGMITALQYEKSIHADVVFTEGQVGYDLDYVMEMVKDAVATDTVRDALEKSGISNLATAGLRVITTVDKDLQKETLYWLRHELSRLDIRLRGYDRDEVQKELSNTNYRGDRELVKRAFLFGTIVTKDPDGLLITFAGDLNDGLIDRKGLDRPLKALVKWTRNRWSEVKASDLSLLTDQLEEGDRVWVSVREIDTDGSILLDLERFPQMQGGALIMQKGMIKAMAGGVENRFYNRAIAAKRTMGSAFKPYLYAAALQLGWNAVDLLQNTREVFVYQDQPYFPRPDHTNTADHVSMSWAGVRSENLASIWLLYHLCDRLSVEDFRDLADHLGLAPRINKDGKQEPYTLYRTRIRDKHGIVLNRATLKAAAFTVAVRNLETDFLFENRIEEYEKLQNLSYGLNFGKYIQQIDIILDENELSSFQRKEQLLRKRLLQIHYLGLIQRQQQLREYRNSLEQQAENPFGLPIGSGESNLYFDRVAKKYVFTGPDGMNDNLSNLDSNRLYSFLSKAEESVKEKFWNDVLLDSYLSSAALSLVEKQVMREYQQMATLSPYSLDVLSGVHDFRVLVGLQYLIALGHEMGISSQLDPVLSFPLGSNVVTLLETVRMYESLIRGSVSLIPAETAEQRDLLAVLDRIETLDGEVVYQTGVEQKEVLKAEPRLALNHMLENTVKFGTGRYAQKNARLPIKEGGETESLAAMDLVIPLLGKTGTANNYTNASFFGYVPGVSAGGTGMILAGGYAMGVYVGFDNNQPMRRKSTKITGSGGALPTWTGLVNTLLREKGYASELDPVDLSFYGLTLLQEELGQINLGVNKEDGGRLLKPLQEIDEKNRMQPSITTFGQTYDSGRFKATRNYAPFWGDKKKIVETDL